MAILSDKTIKAKMEAGQIVINPFSPDQLNGTSYDVTLGEYFYRMNKCGLIDPTDKTEVMKQYVGPFVWPAAIHPGEAVLCHTHEFIGSLNPSIDSFLATKSTAARMFLDVCKGAGKGDPGFATRWALELQNDSPNPIWLQPGTKIAQVMFRTVDCPVDSVYGINQGQYQRADPSKWTPADILPGAMKVVPLAPIEPFKTET